MTDYIDSYYARTLARGEDLPRLEEPLETEICVIGGGLAGLTTALSLAEKGRDVALLEAHRIGWGASGRNGGFVNAGGYSLPLRTLINRRGLQHARQLYEINFEAWRLVGDRIVTYEMTGVDRRDGLLMPSWFDNDDAVHRYRDFMASKFDREMRFVGRAELQELARSPRYYAGLADDNFFHFHPLNYCLGIGRAIIKHGGQIFEQSAALQLKRKIGGFQIDTAQASISCREIVLALGGYQTALVPRISRAVLPIATYIVLTESTEETLLENTLATRRAVADDKFATDYYRRVENDKILWGGRISARLSEPPNLSDLMIGDLNFVYPQLHTKADVAWMGTMSYAGHRMPQIGRTNDEIWYAQAFGGSGMVATTSAGSLIAEAICGESDRYLQFKPFSIPWAGGPLGRLAAQLTYWSYQARDKFKAP